MRGVNLCSVLSYVRYDCMRRMIAPGMYPTHCMRCNDCMRDMNFVRCMNPHPGVGGRAQPRQHHRTRPSDGAAGQGTNRSRPNSRRRGDTDPKVLGMPDDEVKSRGARAKGSMTIVERSATCIFSDGLVRVVLDFSCFDRHRPSLSLGPPFYS